MKRIICIGNRYIQSDSAGPCVYDYLKEQNLSQDIEVIDGGLHGIDLLRFIEGAERVVFVDSIYGFGNSNKVVVMEAKDIVSESVNRYDHSAGLLYLLQILPHICEGDIPYIYLVGIEGLPNNDIVKKAACIAVKIADGVCGDFYHEK
ncbi:MAG: hydrogenase maturation protease [Desulfobacterales bacterium]|nr:hydrogenase maturation protease [Desulfobacterales bacterium]MBF0396258.1 hydrogenase maturation protease [Desulfobacterales bacterium]